MPVGHRSFFCVQKCSICSSGGLHIIHKLFLDHTFHTGYLHHFYFKGVAVATDPEIRTRGEFLAGISSDDDRVYDKLHSSGESWRGGTACHFEKK